MRAVTFASGSTWLAVGLRANVLLVSEARYEMKFLRAWPVMVSSCLGALWGLYS
jgi:hypothetical protein